jgi:hypothetical protein
VQLALLTSEVVTRQELAWSALLCWTLFCVTLGVAVLKTEAKARPPALERPRISRARLTQVVTVALVVLLVLFGLRLIFEEVQPGGVVVGNSAVMSGPGEDYLYLYDLSAAAEVYILEERDGWVHFAMADGRQGWLEASTVEAINS